MPQVVPFIKAAGVVIGKFLATKTAIGITYGTIAKVALVAGSVAHSRAQAKKMRRQLKSLKDQGTTATFADPVATRRLIYGEVRTGGTTVFAHTNGTKNEMLHQMIVLAKKPVYEIGNTFFGDEDLGNPWGGGNTPDVSSPYYGKAWVYKNRGETGLADTNLIANAPEVWTSNHKLVGLANIYVEMQWDQDVYPQGAAFNISSMVKGHWLWDPRSSSDEFSSNPALCLRDYLVNEMGVSANDIDDSSVIAAANICDETLTDADGNSVPRYTCNLVLDTADSPADNRNKIAACMAGWCKRIGGKWIMEAGAHKSSAWSITLDDLRGEIAIQAQSDITEASNAVRAVWIDPNSNWQPVDAPMVIKTVSAPNITAGARVTILSVGTTDFTAIGAASNTVGVTFTASGAGTGTGTVDPYLGEDSGIRKYLDLELHGCTNQPEALRLMRIALERARHDMTVVLPCKFSAYRVQAGDYVDVTASELGWTNKLFRVERHARRWEMGDDESSPLVGIDLQLREVSSAIFARASADETTSDPAPNTDSQSPSSVAAPTNLTLSSGTSQLIKGSDGSIVSRILAEWDAPADPYVTNGGRIDVQYKLHADADWLTALSALGSDTSAFIAPVEDGSAYDVRIRSRSPLGVASDWVTSSNHTVAGKTTAPTVPSSLTATGLAGAILLEWTNPADVDLAAAEIWTAAANTFPGGAGIRIPAAPNSKGTYRIENLSGGTTRYAWVGSVDTSDNQSTTQAGSANATALSGTAGSDAYTVVLDMAAPVVACDASGTANAGELGSGGRVRTNVYVSKGTTALTATTGTPGTGQYRVLANGSAVNGSATFSSGYNIRLDTATADTGSIPYKVELEGTATFFALNWSFVKAKTGAAGDAAVNVVPVSLYKRSASSPTLPSTTATYTFATGGLTGHNNGWTQAVPATDGNPLWVTAATANAPAGTATDTIASGEWASPVKILEDGADGTNGSNGLNQATVYLFQRATSTPSVPASTLTYTFATGVLSGTLGAWTQYVPSGSNPIYVTTAVAISSGATDTIATGEWSTPQIHAQNGTNGTNGTNGADGAGYGGTSSTFNTIGTGSKTFYIGTGYAYQVGTRARVASSSSPSNWVEGVASSYTSGSLTLNVDITGGSGSYSSWTVHVAGDIGPTGATGATGATGDTGPGIVYRGAYSGSGTYFQTSTRRDVVSYSGSYYLANNPSKSGLSTWGTPGGADWTSFGSTFSSVATDLLLTVDATILKTLVMGDGSTSNAGIIRSAGASAFGSGTGFWIGYDGTTAKARFGNPSGNKLEWDGTTAKVVGTFSAGTGDALLNATSSGTTMGNTSSYHVSATTTVSGRTVLDVKNSSSTVGRLGAYDIGGGYSGGQLDLSTTAGVTMTLTPARISFDGVYWEKSGSNMKSTATVEVGALKHTYLESGVTTAVDVKDVNLRGYSGGTQNWRIDYTNGRYYVQGNAVLNTRYGSTPTDVATLVACLQHHGLCP